MKFVILDHKPSQTPPDSGSSARTENRHFDLMFEIADEKALSTFAMEFLPEAGSNAHAIPLAGHRNEYLTYEGPISKNRGTVTRYASGIWTGELSKKATLSFDDDSKHFANQTWMIQIDSTKNVLLRIA